MLHYKGTGDFLGYKCKLGDGCKILGKVTLARGTKIAPNALVVKSVKQEYTTLLGNPANSIRSQLVRSR